MSQYKRSTGRGSCPTSTEARSRTLPAMPYGLRLSLHSPQPIRPVSVSMRTKVHGRQPPSACSASTRAIFMETLRPTSMHARPRVCETVFACQKRRNVCGNPKIRGVSERRHAAEADEQIEAEGEDRGDQDLAGEVDVEIAGQERWEQQRSGNQGDAKPFHAVTLMPGRAQTGPAAEMR